MTNRGAPGRTHGQTTGRSVRGGDLAPDLISALATESFDTLSKKFATTGRAVDFDFRAHCTTWTSRSDHFTHRMHRYPGRLTPYIPLYFLGVEGVAVTDGRLLDPFAGCGTVLVEAPVHPCHPMAAQGLEINPLARLIAKVKTTAIPRRAILDAWDRICEKHAADRSRRGLPDFPNKRHWFTETVEKRLARALRALDGLRDTDLRDFFLVAISSVVRQVALADPRVSVPVILNPQNFRDRETRRAIRAEITRRQDADPFTLLAAAVKSNLARLQSWVEAVSGTRCSAAVVGPDARTFALAPYISAGQMSSARSRRVAHVDLVLTSPPYANAQRYTRSLRLELFTLGYTTGTQDESALDKQQVGTERVSKGEIDSYFVASDSQCADKAIRSIRRDDPYRAAIVGKYVHDMAQVMRNCHAALTKGGHAVFVIGNNSVRGRVVNNAQILAELGVTAGFEEILRVKNRIPSRGLLTKRHPTAGVITHEHVVVLRKPSL